MSSMQGTSGAGRLRLHALVAVFATVPLALFAIWWFRREGYLADTPYWLLVTLILLTALANALTYRWLRADPDSRMRLQVRLAASCLTTAAVIYATGWGPMLVIAYLVAIGEMLQESRSQSWRLALFWSGVGVLGGQLAIHLGWAPSLLEPRVADAVAVSAFVCMVIVARILGINAATAEHAERELRVRGDRFQSLIRHATDLIAVIRRDGVVTFASPASEVLLGRAPEELTDTPLRALMVGDDWSRVDEMLGELIDHPGRSRITELRLRHADGSERLTVACLTCLADADQPAVVANIHDITTQRELEERLRHDAMHDALTGLWNRAAFTQYAEKACARAARDSSTLALLFVDLDDFKQVNDTHGHELGDQVLIEVALRLRGCLRGGEVIARLGGDEFTVLLEGIERQDVAIEVADRILAALAPPTSDATGGQELEASVGIALNPAGRLSLAELLREADGAMYAAKRTRASSWELVGS
jgi:diguanylate cyclase (GGDEF)-like protein/PAS domain S-box-containing protein